MRKGNGRMIRFLAGALVAAPLSLAMAQPEEGLHGGHGRRGVGGPMGAMRILRELDLSEEQRSQIRTLFEESKDSGVQKRLFETRKALHEAIESGADEGTLRQLASDLGEAEGDAAVERSRVQAQVKELLTVEQRQELERLKQEAAERREERQRRFEERKSRRDKEGVHPL